LHPAKFLLGQRLHALGYANVPAATRTEVSSNRAMSTPDAPQGPARVRSLGPMLLRLARRQRWIFTHVPSSLKLDML
jgi:hypothetical protein